MYPSEHRGLRFFAEVSLRVTLIFSCGCWTTSIASANEASFARLRTFVESNCLDCHSAETPEGDLNLADLLPQLGSEEALQNQDIFDTWVQVVDRVRDDEMPPADYGEAEGDVDSFVVETSKWLRDFQANENRTVGRAGTRRLTNVQLERTLHDLLGIDVPLAVLMPDEPRTNGFTNIAAAQSMSHFQLENHLVVVDAALDAAFHRAAQTEATNSLINLDARGVARRNPKQRCRDPEMRDGLAVVWNSTLIFYGRITSTTVRRSGWYRFTFEASAVKPPEEHGVWCSVRSGACTSGAPLMSWIGAFEATAEPQQMTFEAWLPKGHMLEIRPADATLDIARFRGGQVGVGEGEPQDVPGVALHWMKIEEIHPGGSVADVRKKLFGDLPVNVNRDTGEVDFAREVTVEELVEQLHRFSQSAFRRDLEPSQVDAYASLVEQAIADAANPIDALRAAYRAVLCSPRFIYFTESPGKLDGFALANRLSYLLWGSMPDEELMTVAKRGELSNPSVLREQVERMLHEPRGKGFMAEFAGQWLDLVDIDFTEPDKKLHRNFDIVVQNSMLDETHAFLQTMLDENLPAYQLIDADFTFVNSRLARYYDLPRVDGTPMRRIDLPGESVRGGLLGQGAILKVTANGTNTSPVLRGIWASQRLLGQPIADPPESVPAIEPDVRGATTIREMLAKHKADASCASCHKKIDPPGHALEIFDAAGSLRQRYTVVNGGKSKLGPPIDASDTLPDGRTFGNFNEFRRLWRDTPQPVARCFVEHLLTYATGAEMTFADREPVDAIVSAAESDDLGLRTLLHSALASPIFLEK